MKYPIKAKALNGNWIEFGLEDVPVRLSDSKLILLNRPMSPILRKDTIVRGMDVDGLFEGDIVMYQGVEYVIKYDRGFIALSSKDRKFIHELGDYTVIGNIMDKPHDNTLCKKFRYKYRDTMFFLEDINGHYKSNLIIRGVSLKLDTSEVQQYAGLKIDGECKFFGDVYSGNVIEMVQGRVCIQTPDGPLDLVKKEILGGYVKC